jgi:glycosyltransferase involved in cell wall biosynthesis
MNPEIKCAQHNYVSVIMPVFNQASFIRRTIVSLLCQTYPNWELIIINDGSTDSLDKAIASFLPDKRIKLFNNEKNKGLGYSLNYGIEKSQYNYIAYLPADDIYYKNHLESLVESINLGCDLAHAGMLCMSGLIFGNGDNFGKKVYHKLEDKSFQLVQIMHRKTVDRWVERSELVTDMLDVMFWNKFLENNPKTIGTREISCEWVDHPAQRHKIIDEHKGGNIFLYKSYYGVKEPIRFENSYGTKIDEFKQYEFYRKQPIYKKEGLKILMVGELAYNPERICAFEEDGHKLYGLWISNPSNFNTIGALPFGNVEDVLYANWIDRVKEIKPDIIYALLNDRAIPLAHEVLLNNPGVPFVWHFKEGPVYARTAGTWSKLVELYTKSDGQIYINELTREWFRQFIAPLRENEFILDGDLQKNTWFTNDTSPLLSDEDGEIHILIAGRPYGITAEHIKQMAEQKIHLHIYGQGFYTRFKDMLDKAKKSVPNHLHIHDVCFPKDFVKEFSKYDAGFLHYYRSDNDNELIRVNWNDINFPARMSTYAMAGIPMLIYDNVGQRVASQEFLEQHNMALKYTSIATLGNCFKDKDKFKAIRESVWSNRDMFSFDYHIPNLIRFFHKVIQSCGNFQK